MRRLALAAAVVLVVALAGCGPSETRTSTAPPPTVDRSSLSVAARDLRFDRSEIAAPAGAPFVVVFDNQEGVPHNVAIYTDESASRGLYVGQIFGGPAIRTYEVPALAAGTYFFRCDLHPEMNGHLVAADIAAS